MLASVAFRYGDALLTATTGTANTPHGLAFLVAVFAAIVCGVVWFLAEETHAPR